MEKDFEENMSPIFFLLPFVYFTDDIKMML